MISIGVYCVNYNSYDSLRKYLKSIQEAYSQYNDRFNLVVVVTDNSEKKTEIKDDYSYHLIIINSTENLGYFGGIEYGIKKSDYDIYKFDYTIISNVDLELQKDFFVELNRLGTDENVGCIAPSIISKQEKRNRNPKIISRPSRKKMKLQKMLYRYPLLDQVYVKTLYAMRRSKVQNYSAGEIYAAHGSFMIFTRRFSAFLRCMEFPCFLFGEEAFIAENIKKNGLKIVYEPRLVVYDIDHVSTSKMKSKAYYKYNYQAIDMLLREYFNE